MDTWEDAGVIVDSAVYRCGVREPVTGTLARALTSVRGDRESYVWVGLHEPTAAEFEDVVAAFGLHPLAVEDAVNAHQRPKLERYGDSLFVVLKTLAYAGSSERLDIGEIMLFLGEGFVVTVRHGQTGALGSVREALEHRTKLLRCGPLAVLYAVADHIVDEYGDVAGAIEEDVDDVEEQVFTPGRPDSTRDVYELKRRVITVRRSVRPLADPMTRLAAGSVDVPFATDVDALRPFFRDVADHLLRVAEAVEGYDDLLTSVLDANLTQASVRQNDDMRKISAWAAILAVPTGIAGIYGMNFDHMPELHWHYGYPLALALMAGICLLLYRAFKRSGWL